MNHLLPGRSWTEALPRWAHSGRSLTVSSFKEALSLGQAKSFIAVQTLIIPQPAKCYCRGPGGRREQAQGQRDRALPPQSLTPLISRAQPGLAETAVAGVVCQPFPVCWHCQGSCPTG